MKRIEAVIRDEYLEAVRKSLSEIRVEEFLIAEVRSFGKEKLYASFRGADYEVSSSRLLLTILAYEYQVADILDAIADGARTGGVIEGTIMVTTLDEVVRIRAAEVGRAAD